MTIVTLVAMVLARRLNMRTREVASASVSGMSMGNVRRVVFGVVALTALVETSIAGALLGRFCILGIRFLPRWVRHGSIRFLRLTTPVFRFIPIR